MAECDGMSGPCGEWIALSGPGAVPKLKEGARAGVGDGSASSDAVPLVPRLRADRCRDEGPRRPAAPFLGMTVYVFACVLLSLVRAARHSF